ncbi:MAG: adenylate/guanylate cyclase domain-containing protein, partial [Solirubrobacteraceae bacterium]
LPPLADEHAAERFNYAVFAAFMAVVLPAGIALDVRRAAPVRAWLRAGRPPSDAEQDLALRLPGRLVAVHAALWALGAVVFAALNLHFSGRLALVVGITVVIGGAVVSAIGYILAQRILRPVAERALADGVPEQPPLHGVTARVLLAWGLSTALPVLGLVIVGASQVFGIASASGDRLAVTTLALGGLALLVGLGAMTLTARSLADPILGVRRALERVRDGEQGVEVAVYDGSEVGLLQAGFNQMVAGLDERERLRDLLGRQVGEDVARRALEEGLALGGEVREVAVLFVDMIGSTRLAADCPPERVVELLNELFAVVVEVCGGHGGAVNKFEGDAALVVFGAPLEHRDAAGGALAAARELRERLRCDLDGIDVGIGVSAGEAVAGNVGAAERYEYTVIGDPVNEAARLTELAKSRDGRLLASAAALERASDEERRHWRSDGEAELRGRPEPTRLAVPDV